MKILLCLLLAAAPLLRAADRPNILWITSEDNAWMAPQPDDVVFLYADRFDEFYGMRRGITDGRWKYIRCFTPHEPTAPYSTYQFGQAGWTAWQKAWQDGKLKAPFDRIWEAPQAVERLYDTAADPFELSDLAGNPAHARRLEAMRDRLLAKMIEVSDIGIVPEAVFAELAGRKPVATYLAKRKGDLPALVSLAFTAAASDAGKLPKLIEGLTASDPLARYWAAQGSLILGKAAEPAAELLAGLLDDASSAIRVSAAHALVRIGREQAAKAALRTELDRPISPEAQLFAVNALMRIDAMDLISDDWVKRTRKDPKAGEYLKRIAAQIADERKYPDGRTIPSTQNHTPK
jgi:hypothetical protein